MKPKTLRMALLASGAAGLILELTWLRLFAQVLGATYGVAGLVLGTYLGGLGLGAWWFGREQRSAHDALRLLSRLEASAALAAVPIPLLLHVMRTSLPWELAQSFPVQAALVGALVLPPSVLAGGSLPAAVASVRSPTEATWLYAANTLGGVLGAVAAALLPGWVGVAAVYGAAITFQLVVAATAWVLAGRSSARSHDPQPVAEPSNPSGPASTPSFPLMATATMGGFVLLGMEVVWFRLLSTKLHNSALTFGLVLAVVIAALFVGARLAARVAPAGRGALPAIWLAGFASLLLSAWVFALVGGAGAGLPRGSVPVYVAMASLTAVAVVAPPCMLLGASLPLLWSLAGGGGLARRVGRLLATNTVASVLGSAAAGALLLPRLGIHGTFRILATAAALGTVTAFLAGGMGRRMALSVGAACVAVSLLVPLPGVRRFGLPLPERVTLVDTVRGPNGELTVHRDGRGSLHLRHNAIYGLGSDRAPTTARRMGHLPLLRHGAAERVAFLGMGTGITASAVLDHPRVREVLVLELMGEVVALAHHFTESHGSVLSDPRVRVQIGDGRRALAAPGPALDVVISDLFIPWHPGSSDLYSEELFHTVRARLAPDGLFALWIPAYQIGDAEMESIMAAFKGAFPTSEAALAADDARRPIVGLFGHVAPSLPGPVPAEDLRARAERSRFPIDHWLEPAHLPRLLIGPLPHITAPPNREGRPVVEVLAPLSHIRRRELIGARFMDFQGRHFPEGPLASASAL
jgi:spermidine synthase